VNGGVKQGDIIKLDMGSGLGHERHGYRPAIVVSNTSLSRASKLTIICPITNTDRKSPLHVRLDGLATTGFVMCEQVKAVDLNKRRHEWVETVSDDILWDICDIIQGSVEVETVV
jgi:mRNA interferase MazF